jgi:hypothetical protein
MYGDDDPSRLPERTNEAAGAYAQACMAVAKELNHRVIDIWTKMQGFPNWQTSALWYGFNFYASCVASSLLHGFGDALSDERVVLCKIF